MTEKFTADQHASLSRCGRNDEGTWCVLPLRVWRVVSERGSVMARWVSSTSTTFSKNRHGRFRAGDTFRCLFDSVLRRCMSEGLVGGEGFAFPLQVPLTPH
jgi:hypothetical protein